MDTMALVDERGLDREAEERRITEALLKLGRGFVFKESRDVSMEVWDTLTHQEESIRAALRPFDLTYRWEDFNDVGYAYLRPLGEEEGGQGILKVNSLSVLQSYILVILRNAYKEFAEAGKRGRAVITREALDDKLKEYSEETTDWTAFSGKVDIILNGFAKLKIIKLVNDKAISIHPIIADLIDAMWLQRFSEYLEEKKEEVQNEETGKKGPGKREMIDEEEDALLDEEDE